MRKRIGDREGRHTRIVGSGADTSCVRIAIVVSVVGLLAGCGGNHSEELPAACTEGPGAVLKALAKAPAAVAIEGSTPISKCFNRDAGGDDVQIVGTSLLSAAQQLGDRARAGDQRAALRLGYLIGASRKGARRNGLAAELLRRLEAETTRLGATAPQYRRGLRAGLQQG
jgi:hypothetical protein